MTLDKFANALIKFGEAFDVIEEVKEFEYDTKEQGHVIEASYIRVTPVGKAVVVTAVSLAVSAILTMPLVAIAGLGLAWYAYKEDMPYTTEELWNIGKDEHEEAKRQSQLDIDEQTS